MIEVKIRRFAGAQKKPAENLPEQPAGFTKNLIRNKRRTGQKQTRCFWPVWRSKRDLNPRGTFAPYALSRGRGVRRKKRHNEKYIFIVDTMLTRGLDHLHAVHGVQFGGQGDMAVIISKA